MSKGNGKASGCLAKWESEIANLEGRRTGHRRMPTAEKGGELGGVVLGGGGGGPRRPEKKITQCARDSVGQSK